MTAAIAYLQQIRKENPEIDAFLKNQQRLPQCKSLDLSSYLIIPMQRITRYSLLMRQILHYTPKDHPHHDATLIALQLSDEFLEKVNKAIKVQQSVRKIVEITKTTDLHIPNENSVLDLFTETKKLGPRIFLHEGTFIKTKSGRKLTGYLFNDILILIKHQPTMLYRKPYILERTQLTEENECLNLSFENEILNLKPETKSEKRNWINQFEQARKQISQITIQKSPKVQQAIGTLECILLKGYHNQSHPKKENDQIFALATIDDQVFRSKQVSLSNAVFNFSTVFSVFSLDSVLRIGIYRFEKYSVNEYLGQAEIQLDFLEYYGGRETEVIMLKMKDGGFEKISIKMTYRSA
jgi:hypothetical protein